MQPTWWSSCRRGTNHPGLEDTASVGTRLALTQNRIKTAVFSDSLSF